MKRQRKTYGTAAVTAILAVGVFCYWLIANPQLLLFREGMQLFLCNGDYLAERLGVPGGLAQYLGEALVQLFLTPANGAACYALLFVAEGWLTARLLPESRWRYAASLVPPVALWWLSTVPTVPMTLTVAIVLTMTLMALASKDHRRSALYTAVFTPIGYWALGPAVLLLALYHLRFLAGNGNWRSVGLATAGAVALLGGSILASSRMVAYPLRTLAQGVDYRWTAELMGSGEERLYDMLTRQQNWTAIVNRYTAHPTDNPAIQATAQYSMFRLGMIDQQAMLQGFAPSFRAKSSIPGLLMISEVYLRVGMINMSQRNAFEAMEGIPNCNKSARVLHRLVETNLITGQYDVALKYLSILEETLPYRSWAKRMRPLAEHPERIKTKPFYDTLQQAFAVTPDTFF